MPLRDTQTIFTKPALLQVTLLSPDEDNETITFYVKNTKNHT